MDTYCKWCGMRTEGIDTCKVCGRDPSVCERMDVAERELSDAFFKPINTTMVFGFRMDVLVNFRRKTDGQVVQLMCIVFDAGTKTPKVLIACGGVRYTVGIPEFISAYEFLGWRTNNVEALGVNVTPRQPAPAAPVVQEPEDVALTRGNGS